MLCLLLFLFSIVSASARVTILIDSDVPTIRHRRQSSTRGAVLPEACRNTQPVDKEAIVFPSGFEAVSVPWMRADLKPRLVTSPGLRSGWQRLGSLKVRGMNATVQEVIRHLEDNHCLFLPWGGSIRDMVLGEMPHDVDAEVSCTQERIHSLCSLKFGIDNCEKSPWPGSSKLRIGNERRGSGGADTIEPMDIVQWKDTFEVPPTQWEFTPNTMTYYAMPNNGPQALIDLTNMGFEDVCEKKIRITAEEQQWPEWAGEAGKQLIKRLRFWKLRTKGYEARDPQTQYFVVESLKKEFNESEVQKFYCIYVMDGEYHDDGLQRGTCALVDDNNPAKLEESKRAFNSLFETDFGTPFWQKVMKPTIDGIRVQRGAPATPSSVPYEPRQQATPYNVPYEPREQATPYRIPYEPREQATPRSSAQVSVTRSTTSKILKLYINK
uniref:Uncharacterized protein n=1 Tax=Plectus sambesii TaxID=2011161 RepID=A0A914XM45_9BILA